MRIYWKNNKRKTLTLLRHKQMNVSIKIPNISYVDLALIQNHAIQMILRVFCVSKRALFVTTTFIPVIKNSLNNPHFLSCI